MLSQNDLKHEFAIIFEEKSRSFKTLRPILLCYVGICLPKCLISRLDLVPLEDIENIDHTKHAKHRTPICSLKLLNLPDINQLQT